MQNEVDPSYADSWKKYRIIFWALYLLFPGFFAFLYLAESLNFRAGFGLAAYTIVVVYVFIQQWKWRCPRCKKAGHGFFGSPLFRKRCLMCGLPKYAIKNPD